ncbi:hypothetical protein GCM10008022_47460 [Paenibacillus hunanensis]|nr:hypothetical protein GCM10008022_47460 [Paenibacillus hunanensis]
MKTEQRVSEELSSSKYREQQCSRQQQNEQVKHFIGEFDPGSGRTLAACLIHASRAESIGSLLL